MTQLKMIQQSLLRKKLSLILIILTAVLSACDQGMPKAPDIKYQYLIDVDIKTKDVYCIRFKVVNWYPYKIQFDKEVPILECDNVGGYVPDDFKKGLNWADDVVRWAESKTCR